MLQDVQNGQTVTGRKTCSRCEFVPVNMAELSSTDSIKEQEHAAARPARRALEEDPVSVSDRHEPTALRIKAALKPKYSAFTAQSCSGRLSLQLGVLRFLLLSHRFIIQLSSKTHAKLHVNHSSISC